MTFLFWLSAFVIAYVYVGYPALLAVWSARRRGDESDPPPTRLPSVSIIIAARNEAGRLAARLDNLLSLDYPRALCEIIVVSDGSTDGTPGVLRRYRDSVRAVYLPPGGKAAALNAAAAIAAHEVLVFADARQRFAPDALRHLVAPLAADPRIGGATGELILDTERGGQPGEQASVGDGVGLYWRYEKWLRRQESAINSVLGATGAIYALRRDLWRALPADTLVDDVLAPMRAVLAGRRIVFVPDARAFDVASRDAGTELRRKVRTLAGNFRILRLEPRLLLPGRNPVWLQFVSHKLGRLIVPYALVCLFVANIVVARAGLVYSLALVGQVIFYVLALHGAVLALGQRPAARGPAAVQAAPLEERRKEAVNAQLD